MKPIILSVSAAILLATSHVTFAQPPEGGAPPQGERGERGHGPRMNPEERLKKMTEHLGLSPEQQTKIKAIMDKNQAAMEARKAQGKEPTEEEKTKFRESMKAQMEEVSAVLTPEQRQKMQEARKNRRAERQGKDGEAGGPGGKRQGQGKPGGPGRGAPQ